MIQVSQDTKDILERKGYQTLEDYIQDMADSTGADYNTALELFYLLGETELFDGFVTSLEDYSYMMG